MDSKNFHNSLSEHTVITNIFDTKKTDQVQFKKRLIFIYLLEKIQCTLILINMKHWKNKEIFTLKIQYNIVNAILL